MKLSVPRRPLERGFRTAFTGTLRTVLSDRGARLLLVVAPILYSLFYPLPYLREVVREVPVAVVDLDGTSLSRQLVRFVDAHEALRVADKPGSLLEAEAAVREGRVRGFLIIPRGFRADAMRGIENPVAYGGDASYFFTYKQVLTGFAEAAGTLSGGVRMRLALAEGRAGGQALAATQPVVLHTRALGNTREGYAGYLIPGVYLVILQQTLVLGLGLLRGTAKEKGFPGAGPKEFLGALAALTMLYLGHAAFHAGLAAWVYDLPVQGSFLNAAPGIILFVAAAVLFAAALSGFCRTRVASLHLFLTTSVPVLFLSGLSWPFEALPPPLAILGTLIPSTAGIQATLRATSLGAHPSEVAVPLAVLAGLCVLFAWPAWLAWGNRIRCPQG
jgi:ABC-2 type transport system permease protein